MRENNKKWMERNSKELPVAETDEIVNNEIVNNEIVDATEIAAEVPGKVMFLEPDGTPVVKPKQAIVTNCERLNIRSSASKDATVLFIIPVDTILDVDFYENDWAHVRTSDDKEGYVMKAFIKEVN